MPKYTKQQLEDKSDVDLYILAYDYCPEAYDLLPTSRKHLIEALLRCPRSMPLWINVVASLFFVSSVTMLLSGELSSMMMITQVVLSLVIGVSTGFLINWLYETIKPPLPTQSKAALIGFVALIMTIIVLMGVSYFTAEGDTPSTESFVYQVKVVAAGSNEILSGAVVRIYVSNGPPLVDTTDSTGLAIIQINQQAAGQLAKLTVTLDCYQQYDRSLTLAPDQLPQTIPLNTDGGCQP